LLSEEKILSLEIKKLQKTYEGSIHRVLNISDVTFSTATIIRILGINGIGKTTFLSIISGLSNFEGKISINGIEIHENYQKYLSMTAFVGNKLFLYDFLTGNEMIDFVQNAVNFQSNIDNDLWDFINKSGLSEYLNIMTKDMSLGTKQKLSIVLALLASPKVLLLDEPFVNLDEPSKKALIKILKQRSKQKEILTIYATHSKESDIEHLADKTVRLINDKKDGAYLISQL
ncbi:MAG: ABC transporter ATP-binding protein, partial [Lactobacillales bacterium]|nr:ABC transporter ATP-binding protein [Lactobacillales bacterium]